MSELEEAITEATQQSTMAAQQLQQVRLPALVLFGVLRDTANWPQALAASSGTSQTLNQSIACQVNVKVLDPFAVLLAVVGGCTSHHQAGGCV